jgi:hypothetical protein
MRGITYRVCVGFLALAQVAGRIARRWGKALMIVLTIWGLVTFVQFIQEEALQQCTFSLYVCSQALKDSKFDKRCPPETRRMILDRMDLNLAQAREILEGAEWFNRWFGWINPVTRGSFRDYYLSTRSNLDSWEVTIRTYREREARSGQADEGLPCPRCRGTGQFRNYGECYQCNGTGIISRSKQPCRP